MDHFVIVLVAMLGFFLIIGNEQFAASSKIHLLFNFQLGILCLYVVVQVSVYMSVHVYFGKCHL